MFTVDTLQAKIEGFCLGNWYSLNTDQKIALAMLKETLPYDEAKSRVLQAIKNLKIEGN